jgi:hypothetical protein
VRTACADTRMLTQAGMSVNAFAGVVEARQGGQAQGGETGGCSTLHFTALWRVGWEGGETDGWWRKEGPPRQTGNT